jgi:hypothetical protein
MAGESKEEARQLIHRFMEMTLEEVAVEAAVNPGSTYAQRAEVEIGRRVAQAQIDAADAQKEAADAQKAAARPQQITAWATVVLAVFTVVLALATLAVAGLTYASLPVHGSPPTPLLQFSSPSRPL